ncbi:MAG: relaxase/mobilization nuclease domain-containing protein [Stigonema ocellatum SAG 48.90 = DSM 106950]|nr:relaxase/mobilization nuclease domain-containing protein [Stigonema ocellatum SAG 48.90 = DSM 106950]
MIGKQIKGTDFYGCLDYVLGKEGAELIGGNMVGETPAELSQEFQLSLARHERTRTKKPTRKVVYHATLSVPAEETLSNDTWCAIAEDYLQGMGFDDNQYILARHTDTEHNHVHIVASRLRLNGSTVSEWQDYKRSEELIRDLEKKYELTPAPSSFEKERRSPTTGERRLTNRTGETSARKTLQDTIDQLTQDSPTMPDLIGQLKDQGIDVRVSPTPTGEMGISYQLNGIAFSGIHLGKAYTFKGLQKYRGVSYSEKQEQEVVEQALGSPVAQAEEQQQQQAQLAHQNEIRKRQEEEEKKSRTETTSSPDSYPATPNNLDSEQRPESYVNLKQQQQAAKKEHKKRSRLQQQQSIILDDENTSFFEQYNIDNNDSEVKRKQELFDVATETASTIQQPRRSGDVDGDQRETKLHQGESQAAQNRDYSQTNSDTQEQQSDRLRQPTIQTQNQESDTQLEDEEVNVAKRVYWLEQSNQVAGQSKQQILYGAESMPTSQFDQMPQIPKQQLADAAPETIATVLPDRNENNWQAVQEYLVGDRQLPKQIVELLHAKGWIYADDEGQTVFVGRTLEGEQTGAFVLNDNTFSSIRLDPDEPATPDEEDTTLTGCFWVATFTPIQRAVLTSDPVEVLSVMAIDPDFNQTPTLYLAADNVKAIPKEFLEKLPTVVVGLKGDEEGDAVSEEILAALPQARRINPGMAGWNKILTDETEDIKSKVQELPKKQTGDLGLDID